MNIEEIKSSAEFHNLMQFLEGEIYSEVRPYSGSNYACEISDNVAKEFKPVLLDFLSKLK